MRGFGEDNGFSAILMLLHQEALGGVTFLLGFLNILLKIESWKLLEDSYAITVHTLCKCNSIILDGSHK